MGTRTSYLESLVTSLQRLKEKESMTDVTLILPDHSQISCHKLVLMAASPFFETMFQSGLKESEQREVQLDFSNAPIIQMLIDYFYSGEIDINTDNVQDLVAASEFLCLADLKAHLGAFMTDQVDAANCIELHRYARKYRLGKLVPHCFEHILSHYQDTFRSSPQFTELSEEELTAVVSDDRLSTENENIVFHSVVFWVNADLAERKESFERIASFIRFPFCTQVCLDYMIGEPLMFNPRCIELFHEAINIRSKRVNLHSMYSARMNPRQTYTAKKESLLMVYAKTTSLNFGKKRSGFVFTQSTIDSVGRSTDAMNGANTFWTHKFSQGGMSQNCFFPSSESVDYICGNTHFSCHIGTNAVRQLTWVEPQRSEYSLFFVEKKIFAIGGQDVSTKQWSSDVESFDQQKDQWRKEPSLLQAVSKPYVVHFGNKVYALGGDGPDGPTKFTQEFEPVFGQWQMKKEMPDVCQSGAAVSLNDNIFVVGGKERACFRYTPATDTWTVLSQTSHVHNFTAATAWKGNILLCGWEHGEEYNVDGDNWSPCDELVPNDMSSNKPIGLFTFTST